MLPSGHIAGGYLLARLLVYLIPALSNPTFVIFTSFFAFIPDLDMFVAFAKARRMTLSEDHAHNHRGYASHAPLLYLFIFVGWVLVFPGQTMIAIAFIVGTWSHFILDSFAPTMDGIRWLYPFSKRPYSFNLDPRVLVSSRPFFQYWTEFVRLYTKTYTFKLEMIILLVTIFVLIYV